MKKPILIGVTLGALVALMENMVGIESPIVYAVVGLIAGAVAGAVAGAKGDPQ